MSQMKGSDKDQLEAFCVQGLLINGKNVTSYSNYL